MPEGKAEEKKDEGKIVLETRMYCEECRYKVYKAIVSYPGVEDVSIDLKENKATIKAPKVDAKKLFESVKKKSRGKITKLLYPDPSVEKKKEEPKKEQKKPTEVTVVLKAGMDCSHCTRRAEKAAWQIKDVQSVKAEGETLTVKGMDLEPQVVCGTIIKKTGKYAEVVPQKKKEGEKKEGDSAKKDENKGPLVVIQYVPAPQYFSDENPNACSVM